MTLKSPYPYFGGKSAVASLIWERLGDVPIFVDPFFGSGAILLGRPHAPRIETVNDIDGLLANAWRAIQYAPEEVAQAADWPVSEVDLHAWHAQLVRDRGDLTERLMADPTYYDAVLAGKWIWGASCWIGSGWCSGRGPWQVIDGKLQKAGGEDIDRTRPHLGDGPRGVTKKRPTLQNSGRGVQRQGISRQLPYLHSDQGVHSLPDLSANRGAGLGISRQARRLSADAQGVNVQVPHLGNAGRSVHRPDAATDLYGWMDALSERLRRVRVCCGDWMRVLGPAGTVGLNTTGVILDPPYTHAGRVSDLYAEDHDVWAAVRSWAVEHGEDPRYRIVLCGYADDPAITMPKGWGWHAWKANGGYANQGTGTGRENAGREVIWWSRHCVQPLQNLPLFAGMVPDDEASA